MSPSVGERCRVRPSARRKRKRNSEDDFLPEDDAVARNLTSPERAAGREEAFLPAVRPVKRDRTNRLRRVRTRGGQLAGRVSLNLCSSPRTNYRREFSRPGSFFGGARKFTAPQIPRIYDVPREETIKPGTLGARGERARMDERMDERMDTGSGRLKARVNERNAG